MIVCDVNFIKVCTAIGLVLQFISITAELGLQCGDLCRLKLS